MSKTKITRWPVIFLDEGHNINQSYSRVSLHKWLDDMLNDIGFDSKNLGAMSKEVTFTVRMMTNDEIKSLPDK